MPTINKEVVSLNPIKTKPLSEDGFLSRRLSRDFSIRDTTSSSFEVYYRSDGSIGIPFLWESRPGTPKIKSRESTVMIPPLTPPPSFHSSPVSNKPVKKQLKNNLVPTLLNLKKTSLHLQSPSRSSSSASSSPWSSLYSSPHGISSSTRMSIDSRMNEEDDDLESPVSIFCFRAQNGRSRGCSSTITKLFL